MPPLGYGTNLHAVEDAAGLAEILAAWAGPLRERLGWERLGVDLRLGLTALSGDLGALRRTLDRHRLSAHTINGFPLLPFQAARVKENAYLPDWSEPERLEASLRLLDAALVLSDEPEVTISTSPGSFRSFGAARNDPAVFARALGFWAAAAFQVYRRCGRTVVLCPEPEPWCSLETSVDIATFWSGALAEHGMAACAERLDDDHAAAHEALRRHLGICFDTCHVSLAFEDQAQAVARIRSAGARIAKCQYSAAPEARNAGEFSSLAAMSEPRFLHQSALIDGHGRQERCVDLDGLAAAAGRLPGWTLARSHFHVPVDAQRLPNGLATTIADSRLGLAACVAAGCTHIAVETYTWPLMAADDQARMQGTERELRALAAAISRV